MDWQTISNIASVVSIGSAIYSGVAWYKTKGYYHKIAKNSNLEKLSLIDKNLVNINELYKGIKKYHIIKDERGRKPSKIIGEHLEIENNLKEITDTLPSKNKGILGSIVIACKQLDEIDKAKLYCESNTYFSELGTYIKSIESGVKLEKENIRGY